MTDGVESDEAALQRIAGELTEIQDQARRYMVAAYGEAVWFRAPETFNNVLERWIWAVSGAHIDMAEECMSKIEELAARSHSENQG
jgi:hypothetical protein